MFLQTIDNIIELYPFHRTPEYNPYVFTNDEPDEITCWDIKEHLRQIGTTAIGKLVKTSNGYSPLLITREYGHVDSRMTDLVSDLQRGLYVLIDVPFGMILAALQQLFGINLGFFYNHLLDNRQARSEGFFFVEGNVRGLISTMLNSFIIECEKENAECVLVPHNITVDELVPLIMKRFSGISGYFMSNYGLSVYFFDRSRCPTLDNRRDFRDNVSYVIDKQRLKYYIYPRTRRELCRSIIEELDILTNRALLVSSVYENLSAREIEEEINALLQVLEEEKDHDMNNQRKSARNSSEPHHTMSHFIRVPIRIQIAACARIMGVSAAEADMRLKAASDQQMVQIRNLM